MRLPTLAVCSIGLAPSLLHGQRIPTVDASGPGVWTNPRLVEELRIGQIDGPDEYIFGSVTHIAPMPDGSMFVVDGQGPRLRLYSPDGRFLRDVGRTGEGPGEYRGIHGLDVTPAGELAVYDVSLQRITLYDAVGEYVRSLRSHSGGSSIGSGAFRVDTAGTFMVFAARLVTRTTASGRTIGIEGQPDSRSIYLRLSPTGEPLDSLVIPKSKVGRQPSFVVMAPEGYYKPFVQEFVYAPSPHGYLLAGYTSEYVIERLDAAGEPISSIRRDHDPLPVRRQERSQWQARADFYSRRGGAGAGVTVPEMKPPFRGFEVDEDGRIWVNRYAEAVEYPIAPDRRADAPPPISWRDRPTFDVIDADGQFLGTVTIPPGTQILVRSGNQLWGVETGEFNEPRVVRFRLVTGG